MHRFILALLVPVTLTACGNAAEPELHRQRGGDLCDTQYGSYECADDHVCFDPAKYGRNGEPERCVKECEAASQVVSCHSSCTPLLDHSDEYCMRDTPRDRVEEIRRIVRNRSLLTYAHAHPYTGRCHFRC